MSRLTTISSEFRQLADTFLSGVAPYADLQATVFLMCGAPRVGMLFVKCLFPRWLHQVWHVFPIIFSCSVLILVICSASWCACSRPALAWPKAFLLKGRNTSMQACRTSQGGSTKLLRLCTGTLISTDII